MVPKIPKNFSLRIVQAGSGTSRFRSVCVLRNSLAASRESALVRKAASDYGTHKTVFKDLCLKNGSSRSPNLALTVLCVPCLEAHLDVPVGLSFEELVGGQQGVGLGAEGSLRLWHVPADVERIWHI